ncbi:type IV pilin [Natrarchaeobius halalkaliphilus]|uniref:Type IV pilin n=1 Tax=Natrarchaeobius halalkaliphilus TaxID=1679091 RepID=A0A3N6M1J1_9EURY|nr:type IV pilin N-terminal domain-containing protein [Natrarchaeobius halalkaliphilus]RQG88961.1 type IV pilin [Natrarchaeobius halalkaliphilus]
MNGKQIRNKLVGSEEERAVSPVIGVILMVAITVILAAVIAAFVLDLGGSVGQEAQAGVSMEVDNNDGEVQVEVSSIGNSDHVEIGGDADFDENLNVGDVQVLNNSEHDLGTNGTVTAIAVINESDTRTQVASESYDFSE